MKVLTPDQLKALVQLALDRKPDPSIIPELVSLGWMTTDSAKITPLGRDILRFANPKYLKPTNTQ